MIPMTGIEAFWIFSDQKPEKPKKYALLWNGINNPKQAMAELEVAGIGTITLYIYSNVGINELEVNNVLYVPSLITNIISIGNISGLRYNISFNNEKC